MSKCHIVGNHMSRLICYHIVVTCIVDLLYRNQSINQYAEILEKMLSGGLEDSFSIIKPRHVISNNLGF